MIQAWHHIINTRNPAGIADLLADDVTFHSPVVHSPQQGKKVVNLYLTAACYTFLNDTFIYVRELVAAKDAVLEFTVTIDDIIVNGVDMIRWNDAGQIVDFKVMLRPLKAVHLIHQKMAKALAMPH